MVTERAGVSIDIKIGRVLRLLGRLDAAEARYRTVLERSPQQADALVGLGEIAQSRGDLEAAVGWFQAAAVEEPERPMLQIRIADVLCQLSRFDEAQAIYRSLLEASPDSVPVLIGLGNLERQRGRDEAALALFQTAADKAPGQGELLFHLASTLRDLGRVDEAEKYYHAALELRPGHAQTLEMFGRYRAAERRFDRGTGLVRGGGNRAGRCFRRDQDWPCAATAGPSRRCRSALSDCAGAGPQQADALVGLGEIARSRGDLEAAVGWFQAAAVKEPERPMLQIRIADVLCQLSRFDEAQAIYRSLLEASPDFVPALIGLGNLERKQGRDEAALALFQTAADKAPSQRAAWFHLIATLRSLCRFDEAEAILVRMGEFAEGEDTELQVRRFEHFCLTLQLAEAEKRLLAWGGHRNVPRAAVNLAVGLYAALGHWADLLEFVRERLGDGDWIRSYERMFQPLVRAARATGRYREVFELLDRLPEIRRR